MTRPASGRQFHIRSGRCSAQIGEVAAVLRAATWDGQALTETWADEQVAPMGCGMLLAPWPNRVAGAVWQWDGRPQQLDITEPSRGNATHGLLRNTAYAALLEQPDRVELAASIHPQHGFPFSLDTLVGYQVSDAGLTVTHTATNVGATVAPFGLGTHPYLRVGDVPAADLTVTVRAGRRVISNEKLIPVRTESIDEPGPDLRGGARVGDLDIDMAFTDLESSGGRVEHELRAPDGRGLVLWADEVFAWAHVYTPRNFPGPGQPDQRSAVAVEPMTCPADALNSGAGLIRLEPGETWSASWGLRPDGW